jgi:hypothetical protein
VIAGSVLTVMVLCGASTAGAQDNEERMGDVLKSVALDPTTYVPAGLGYTSARLDWASSQIFFQHGFAEHNPMLTTSGRPDGVPVGYGVGNQRILNASLVVLGTSSINNMGAQVLERALTGRWPEHRRLFHVMGWVERMTVASYGAYKVSSLHFEQWQRNIKVANELGYR